MAIKIKEKEYKLKRDRYKQARSGCSRLFNIHCRKCNNIVVVYQKDGIGTVLRRLYMDRILAPKNLVGLQKQILKRISVLECKKCGHILGMPYIYKKEKRKSFRLHKNSMIKTEDAYAMARQVVKKEGIFVGMSSGAAMYAAVEVAKKIRLGIIVVIFPDRGEKYLSTNLFFNIGKTH